MELDSMETYLAQIEMAVRTQKNPDQSWSEVLRIARMSDHPLLALLDVSAESDAIVKQVVEILGKEPPPPDLTFVYFGLFDLLEGTDQQPSAGYYMAGGSANDPAQALAVGDLSYFPDHRFLQSSLLDQIKEVGRQARDTQTSVLDYAVMLGAAATLAKAVACRLGFNVPVFSGFDSGDFVQIAG